jgi:hypothetical protein
MKIESALEQSLQPDYRLHRARSLTGHVMHILDKHMPYRDETNARRKIYGEILEAFHKAGVDIITEHDRRKAGLEPRNEKGITPTELQIMELKRVEAMLLPIPFISVKQP